MNNNIEDLLKKINKEYSKTGKEIGYEHLPTLTVDICIDKDTNKYYARYRTNRRGK